MKTKGGGGRGVHSLQNNRAATHRGTMKLVAYESCYTTRQKQSQLVDCNLHLKIASLLGQTEGLKHRASLCSEADKGVQPANQNINLQLEHFNGLMKKIQPHNIMSF